MSDLRDDLLPGDADDILAGIEKAEGWKKSAQIFEHITSLSADERRSLLDHFSTDLFPQILPMPMKIDREDEDYLRDSWKYNYGMQIFRPHSQIVSGYVA